MWGGVWVDKQPRFGDISSGTFKIHATNTQVSEERGHGAGVGVVELETKGKDKTEAPGG